MFKDFRPFFSSVLEMMAKNITKEAKAKFTEVLHLCHSSGVNQESFLDIPLVNNLKQGRNSGRRTKPIFKWAITVLSILSFSVTAAIACVWITEWPVSQYELLNLYFNSVNLEISEELCIVPNHDLVNGMFRKPLDCGFCKDVENISRVTNLHQQTFYDKFAYSGRPVIIEDATANWSAAEVFSFQYFKDLYSDESVKFHESSFNCQFFPYQTNFKSLGDLFKSTWADPSNALAKPWYVGW